jgi:hypothetical protein
VFKKTCKANVSFCDTAWEDEVTYHFIKDFETKLGAEIMRLTSMGFVELAKRKKGFHQQKQSFAQKN